MLGWPEVVAILAVVLVLFGARKVPDLARGLGQGIREFRKATREVQEGLEQAIKEPPSSPKSANPKAGSTSVTPTPPAEP